MNDIYLLYGKELKIGNIIVKHPLLHEILDLNYELGEDTYTLYTHYLTTSPKDCASELWINNEIWYEDLDYWHFFLDNYAFKNNRPITVSEKSLYDKDKIFNIPAMAVNEICEKALNFFLKTNGTYVFYEFIDIDKQSKNKNEEMSEICLLNVKEENNFLIDSTNIKITSEIYFEMVDYIKSINWIKKDYDLDKMPTKFGKKYYLENIHKTKSKKKRKPRITLSSMLSGLLAKGIEYNSLWKLPIYAVYDYYYRYKFINDCDNIKTAIYTGNIDKDKIKLEDYDWTNVINF